MKWLASVALVATLGVAGCGTNATGGAGDGGGAAAAQCNTDPWGCPAGQTCAIANEGKAFACLNSGSGKVGASCKSIIDQPQCGDGLLCFQALGAEHGVCSPFCDPSNSAHACANSAACVTMQFAAVGSTRICQIDGSGGAGGTGGAGSTATGTSSATGSGGAGGK
jgi:hypothetical protein